MRAVPRILIAIIGGAAITIALLLVMHEATRRFNEQDPTRYFNIVDFIPAPEGRLPKAPRAPTAPPDRPQLRYDRSEDRTLPVPRPSVDDEQPAPAVPVPVDPGPAPQPDEGTADPDQ